jgi:hypothetical protein
MPCDRVVRNTEERELYESGLKQLEADIATGRVVVTMDIKTGRVKVVNWSATNAAKAGWCEGCALAAIAETGNYLAQAKLARWGIKTGRSFVAASHAGHVHKVGGK